MPKTLDLTNLDTTKVKVLSQPEAKEPASIDVGSIPADKIKIVSIPDNGRKQQRFGPLESAGIGAAEGLSLGFADEAAGLVGAAFGKGKEGESFGERYKRKRDDAREYMKEAQAENPKSYAAGTIGGGLTTAFVPGLNLLNVGKGAAVAGSLGKAAVAGGLAGTGLSEEESVGGIAKDAAKGAALGGALQTVGSIAQKLTPKALKETAANKALAAAGFTGSDVNKLSPEQRQKFGRELLDKKVVTALSSLSDIAEKAGAAKEEAGAAIGNALGKVDDLVQEVKSGIKAGKLLPGASDAQKTDFIRKVDESFQFSQKRIADRIRNEIIEPNINNATLDGELQKLSEVAESFSGRTKAVLRTPQGAEYSPLRPPTLPLTEANATKASLGKKIRFQSDSIPEMYKKDVYDIIKTELEDIVAKTGNLELGLESLAGKGKSIGDLSPIAGRNADAVSGYKAAKETYGAMKVAQDVAEDRLGKQGLNRSVSLTDTIAGVGGLASGGVFPAIALGTLNKISRKYGASVQAVAADKLADGLQKIISKSPEALQKYSPMLSKAAQQGNKVLTATHFALMNEPDYRALMVQDSEEPKANSAMERRMLKNQESKTPGH